MFEPFEISSAELATVIATAVEKTVATGHGVLRRIGIDVVDLILFERQLDTARGRFLRRLLTSSEIEYCQGRLDQLATRVAAKEAAAKVLGTGFRGVRWHDITVVSAANGAPSLVLTGEAALVAQRLAVASIEVSCAHEGRFAVAIAVGESSVPGRPVNPGQRGDSL